MERPLSLLDLNRTLLARQRLLERDGRPAIDLVRESTGLQAQGNEPPYVALWSRLRQFEKAELENLLRIREVVRATLHRSTLHIVAADDFAEFWPIVQVASIRTFRSNYKDVAEDLDIELLVQKTTEFLSDAPRSFPELREHLSDIFPDYPPPSLSWAARAYLPLVQTPPAGEWGDHTSPKYALAEKWLDRSIQHSGCSRRSLALRYLAAFGPATRADMTAWAGVSLSEAVSDMKDDLVTLEDEAGRQLLDVSAAPLPAGEVAAPVRFLHSWDNILLAHRDRRRIISGEAYRRVFLTVGRVLPTVLLDGFVQGLWEWSSNPAKAALKVKMFKDVTAKQREAITGEGLRMLEFLSDGAGSPRVIFA